MRKLDLSQFLPILIYRLDCAGMYICVGVNICASGSGSVEKCVECVKITTHSFIRHYNYRIIPKSENLSISSIGENSLIR